MRKSNRNLESNSHARVRSLLLSEFGYIDMLTGQEIEEFNLASYHHLLKKEYGGEYTPENGAMLLKLTHSFIHLVELKDPELFDLITECLILYKYCIQHNKIQLITQFQDEVQPKVKKLVNSYKSRTKRK